MISLLFGYSLAIWVLNFERRQIKLHVEICFGRRLKLIQWGDFSEATVEFQNNPNNSPLGCTFQFPRPLHVIYLILIKLSGRAAIRINPILQVRILSFRSIRQITDIAQ